MSIDDGDLYFVRASQIVAHCPAWRERAVLLTSDDRKFLYQSPDSSGAPIFSVQSRELARVGLNPVLSSKR